MSKHNKKRNVGIIYELLLRHISNCLVENDKQGVRKATRIIEKRFNKNTELYKEFRLFNAIAKSNVKNTEIAAAIMTEAKAASRRFDANKINKEKSQLIRDINHTINDPSFYYRTVPNYAQYASIQNLLNEWRKGDKSDLRKLVEMERKTIEWLLQEKDTKNIEETQANLESSDSNALIIKIMTEKINKKYGNLSDEQKEIIKNYAIYGSSETGQRHLKKFLRESKLRAIKTVTAFSTLNENEYIGGKIEPVLERIEMLDPNNITDESIVKFLTITKLVDEIQGE
tara:strand:+ start:737 stop:1591 length:855 start_codon:yes stop_codon:yes gene_type:complete